MAAVYGADDEEQRRRALGQAYGAPAAPPAAPIGNPGSATPPSGGYAPGGGLTDAAPGARKGTGYVNLGTYLGANYGVGQQMAQHVAGETARQGDAERAALQGLAAGQMVPGELAGRVQDTAARARLAAPGGGGLGAVLAQDYGQAGPYSSGMGAFDAFLAGGAGGKTLQASGNAYGGLGGEVDAANKRAAAYTPPAAAPPPTAAALPGPVGGVPSAGASGPGYYGGPGPVSPLTYNPEQGERPTHRGGPQQMDPGVSVPWWKRRGGG